MSFLSDLLFGSENRSSANEKNWQAVNDARGDYAAAQAYQSYFKNLQENDPEKYKQIADNYDMNSILSDDFLKPSGEALSEAQNYFKDQMKRNRYNEFGNGIIGSLINPAGQAASLVGDTVYGATTGNWDNFNKRDLLSDLGAIAETGLNLATGGALGSGANLATKAGKAALTNAAANAVSTLREQGSDATLGDVLGSAAFGGAIGGALPVVGAGLGKVGNSLAKRGVANGAAATASKASQIGQGIKSFIPKTKLGKGAALAAGAGGAIGLGNLLGNGGQQNDVYSGYNNYGGY